MDLGHLAINQQLLTDSHNRKSIFFILETSVPTQTASGQRTVSCHLTWRQVAIGQAMQRCNTLCVRSTLNYQPDLPLHHILLPLNFKMLAGLRLLCTQVYRKGALYTQIWKLFGIHPYGPCNVYIAEIWVWACKPGEFCSVTEEPTSCVRTGLKGARNSRASLEESWGMPTGTNS